MPKRVPVEAKRVPLNCLVLPETKAWLDASNVSQGVAVDRAVAGARFLSPALVDGLHNQGRGNQNPEVPLARHLRACPKSQGKFGLHLWEPRANIVVCVQCGVEQKPPTSSRPPRSPLLKPSEKKK